ncbi:hypothetical protein [Azohydromonas caseinilytica]|uniref:Uncharacterized protein n=1 Tax=Azohydromonas caseinilytica TaxID=2728836 RepID=A0A848FCX2_9BURK|nr:hypothetical protein [Azohydromonas caseinilytica]NML16133.1 hypothetical protein [Azohydromonas caseinilytica]
MSSPISTSSSALSLGACPANGQSHHAPGEDVRVTRADGLAGLLGLVQVEVNGQTRTMTQAELEAFQRDQCDQPGGDARVLRSDNHRELLRQSFESVFQRCPTEGALDRAGAALARPDGLEALPGGPDPKLKQDYDSRLAAQGRTTVQLDGFKPPGWEASGGNPAACFKLASAGAQQTAHAGESVVKGGGVMLYESTARRIQTDATASRLALDQIKAHIDSGRAVVAGVNEPSNGTVVNPHSQPVTDHFVAVYGYEMDAAGKVTALLAKDNAVAGTAEVRFEVGADGAITKPAEPKRREEYLRQEYQMSEVRFHDSLKYTGALLPTNDAGQRMFW